MTINRRLIVELLVAAGLVGLAVAWRVINHNQMLAPNLEIVTAATLLAGMFLHRYYGLLVPMVALLISDALIGNSPVALFVWTAFAAIGVCGLVLRRFKGENKKLLLGSAGLGLGSAVFFFLWTNLGVWAVGDGSFYPHTWQGLMDCYAMGIPFFKNTLISGAVLVPAAFAVVIYAPRTLTLKIKSLALR